MLAVQPSLLDAGRPREWAHLDGAERRELGDGAWLELRREWMTGGALLTDLLERVPWRAERRPMYDRVVDVPRLLAHYGDGAPLPSPALVEARRALDDRYAAELGEPLATVGLCCYRDGRDSVAWHGDTIGRGATEDTVVAILSLGAARRLSLRPVNGGPATTLRLAHGDLLVMGGSCQRTWQHCVPKTARPVGIRVSAQFRAHGVR